ncbi:two-component system sensor kinase [Escherichia coli]|nr:two-component system sensor kinase [Escherichia coli]
MRYSPQGSVIDVTLNADNFIVRDNGPGVTPGGSGANWRTLLSPPRDKPLPAVDLGYRIVQRIAKLHGMNVEFWGMRNKVDFEAKVSW